MIAADCGFNLLGTPDNVRDPAVLDNALDLSGPVVIEMRVAFIEYKGTGRMHERCSKCDKDLFPPGEIAHRPVPQ